MIPLCGKSGTIEIDDTAMAALQIRHKSKDVKSELLSMHLWLLRHPKRRPANIWRFVDNWLRKAPATIKPTTVVQAWWATDERTLNQGRAINVLPRPGESMQTYKDRLAEAMRGAA